MVLSMFLVGCQNLAAIYGSGTLATEERDPGPFSGIHVADFVDVIVLVGEAEAVTVRCDDNLLTHIQTVVEEDVLQVRIENGIDARTSVHCTADVTAVAVTTYESSGSGQIDSRDDTPGLASMISSGTGGVLAEGVVVEALVIDSSGEGPAIANGIEATSVDVDVSGAREVVLRGVSQSAAFVSSGDGGITARTLEVVDAAIESSGAGDVWITATGTVTATVTGPGTVHIWGGAVVDATVEGAGAVIEHRLP